MIDNPEDKDKTNQVEDEWINKNSREMNDHISLDNDRHRHSSSELKPKIRL